MQLVLMPLPVHVSFRTIVGKKIMIIAIAEAKFGSANFRKAVRFIQSSVIGNPW